MKERIRGKIVPAVPVPFDLSGKIDDELQEQYITWMSHQDIGGVATWAHTGRGLKLSDDERVSVLEAWRSGCADMAIVCGVGVPESVELPREASGRTRVVIEATVSMAQAAKVGGADGLLVYPPSWLASLPQADERMLEYHIAVADVGLPMLAFFLYEAAGGVSYHPSLVESILNIENVVGMKVATLDSVVTFQDLASQNGTRNELLITGEDRFLGYSFSLGADSALVGIAAAVTDKCVSLIEAWTSEQAQRFLHESVAMDAFAMATFRAPMDGYVQRMLWAAEADGVFSREAFDRHAPLMPTSDRDVVRKALDRIRGR